MLHDAHVKVLRDDLINIIWDMYKDAHGIRPRWMDFKSMSIAELVKLEESTYKEVLEAIDADAEREMEAVQAFETKVLEIIELGAKDRKTAIRWMKESDSDGWYNDVGMLEYELGLPYNYLSKSA